MSKQPGVRAKTNAAASKQPKKKAEEKINPEPKLEEQTAKDAEMARQLQEQLYSEQEESDLELARRLQEEEQSKHPAMLHRPPAFPSRMRPLRPTSATPIHALFQNLFGMMPQPQELEDGDEETTPAMEPGTRGEEGPGTRGEEGATGTQPSSTETTGRARIYGNRRNRSPQRVAGRSPDRARRGAGRMLTRQTRPGVTSGTGQESNEDLAPQVTDMLPGVSVNPEMGRNLHRPYRRFMFGRTMGPGGNMRGPRPMAPMGHQLLGPRENTMNLPDGELDPELMVMDTNPTENASEDDFINIMRDPFLLLLLLSARDPNFLVPDDVDVGDYEALWDLAERLGEVRNRGMKDEEIEKLPTRTYSKPSVEETCSICLSDYKIREKVTLLPCNHEYHQKCLVEWLKRNATCPVCRKDIKGNET